MAKSNILVIGDLHIPVTRVGYLEFCKDLYDEWDCNKVVFIGDVVDSHSISFHDKHPECPSPADEYAKALEQVQIWYKTFPKAKVCIGNHCARFVRRAAAANIPSLYLKSYRDIWKTPNWDWQDNHIIDDIYFAHGHGAGGGVYPASNMVRTMLMSVCIGHFHSAFGVKWYANPSRRIFALDCGCGIDDRAKQFDYARHTPKRSIIGASVIIDGVPYCEIMPCSRGEKYHDSKFRKTK